MALKFHKFAEMIINKAFQDAVRIRCLAAILDFAHKL